MMLAYLKNRLAEKGTWAGLAALAVAIGAMIWYAKVGYQTGALAALGAFFAAIPSHLRWLWPVLARFAILRSQNSTAPAEAPTAAKMLIFAKDDPHMSDLLAAIEAKAAALAAAAEAELNDYTEKHLGVTIAQLGAEANSWYGDFQSAKATNNTKAWAVLASQTAELIDAQAKQIAALQAAAPNAVITSMNSAPAVPDAVISPAN